MHDGPIFFAELVDGLVWERAHEVQVAYDGPGFWAWWEIVFFTAEAAEEEEDDGEGGETCGGGGNPTRRWQFYCHLLGLLGFCGKVLK